VVPSRFRTQVRWATQRLPPSEPLPSARVIQRRVRRRNFPMYTALPPPDYYGPSAPPLNHQRTTRLSTPSHLASGTGRRPRVVPTFTVYRLSGEVPSYTPAASPRLRRRPSPWPSKPTTLSSLEVPHPPHNHNHTNRYAPQSSPYPPDFELAGDLRGVTTLVSLVHLPVSLAEPEPSGSTGPSRRCQGCLPPSPASPGSGCPQLRYAAATTQRCRSFTSTR
jgi:hypothetical protein